MWVVRFTFSTLKALSPWHLDSYLTMTTSKERRPFLPLQVDGEMRVLWCLGLEVQLGSTNFTFLCLADLKVDFGD
jgi:hypothetical protein